MYPFNYHRPHTINEAQRLLEASDNSALLAGGHTLLPAMKLRMASSTDLVDLCGISQLRGIKAEKNLLTIGAMTPHAEVAGSSTVKELIPALAGLAGSIGDRHVRHRGTIGGSLANNDPAADYPAAVLGLNAMIITNHRSISAKDYFTGLYTTALQTGEIILRVEFPVPLSASYAKFRNFASRYAVAGVFIARTNAGACVAVTGAGATGVFRASNFEAALDSKFSPESLENCNIGPKNLMSDHNATPEYRAHLIKVMAVRAVGHPNQTLTFK
jgi:carbon-monoxide dehydrogenase medium subunit